jgi:hypothetical protein
MARCARRRERNATAAEKTFPFLSLPTEIRVRIYRYLFSGIQLHALTTSTGSEKSKPLLALLSERLTAVLATCRYIYEEGRDVLYEQATWRFSNSSHLQQFLGKESNQLTIPRIQYIYLTRPEELKFVNTARLTSLNAVIVNVLSADLAGW